MNRSVKKYDAQLKAKLALELISGKKTLIEICTEPSYGTKIEIELEIAH